MTTLVVPLRSHRQQRAQLAQKIQHAVPGLVLLFAGAQSLAESPTGAERWLALFQVGASALMLGHLVRTLRKKLHLLRRNPAAHAHETGAAHHGVEWGDIFVAAVMIGEGLERKAHGHHFPRPIYLSAAVLVLLGVFHGRILHWAERRRALRVTDRELFVPGRPFKARRLNATWADVASIDLGERWATVTTKAGRARKLDLRDLEGADHVRHALEVARERVIAASNAPITAE